MTMIKTEGIFNSWWNYTYVSLLLCGWKDKYPFLEVQLRKNKNEQLWFSVHLIRPE